MSYKTDSQLSAEAQAIMNQVVPFGNTKTLVGQMLQDMIDSKPNNASVSGGVTAVSFSTSGATLTLDMNNATERIFFGSSDITASKTFAFINFTNALTLQCMFAIDSVGYLLTFPSNVQMSDARWNSSTKVWTPQDTGIYKMRGVYNGSIWYIEIYGPFS